MAVETTPQRFWQAQFSSTVELVSLPCDRPRSPVPSYRREIIDLPLAPGVSEAIDETCARLGAAPLSLWLAAFGSVLFRHTGQEAIVIGAARSSKGSGLATEPAGWLPLPTHWSWSADLEGEPLIRTLDAWLAEAVQHAPDSLKDLQTRYGRKDASFGARLFNVAMCEVTTSIPPASLERELAKFIPQCDVVFVVPSGPSAGVLRADYDADALDRPTVQRLAGHVLTVASALAARPSSQVLRLPMLSECERQTLVAARDRTPRRSVAPDQTLSELFEAQVVRTPDAVAVTCEGTSLTYDELNRRANRLAHALRARGVGPDVLVGVCLDRSLELVMSLLAVVKAGGAYVPIDVSYPAERVRFIVNDAHVPVLLTCSRLAVTLDSSTSELVCVDDPLLTGFSDEPETDPAPNVTADALAYVIYTSGTTGTPKGSLITHRNVVRLFSATAHWFGFDEHDVWTLFHSVAFDFSVWEIFGALLHGGRLVVVPFAVSRSPEAFYTLLAEEHVTVLNQTPSAFRQLLAADEAPGSPELSLRYVIFGGEALDLQTLRPWFERHGDRRPQLVNMYGITETTVHVTYRPISAGDVEAGSVIGVPIPDLSVHILDPIEQLVPAGVSGEISVGGAGLARGYLGRPELTDARFLQIAVDGQPAERLYRTGDLARRRPDGDVEYLGRADHQVKVRGFRIELGEIEVTLVAHPSVRDAVVVARDEGGSKRLVAYLVTRQHVDATALRDHLARTLPEYMIPAAFVALDALPLTTNGKVDRQALPAPETQRLDLATPVVAPATANEERLESIWRTVLRVDRVGTTDNFFELGGDSILAIQVVSLARRAGLRLTPAQLFRHPTISGLAAAAVEIRGAWEEQDVDGPAPLTPVQHWFFEQRLNDPHHYNQSRLFETREPLDRAALEAALAAVGRHHDALRLRFARNRGVWTQSIGAVEDVVPCRWVDLQHVGESDRASEISVAASDAQETLDLAHGPIWRAVYFDLGPQGRGRLLLVVHHLAVDGVSWQPLLEDLETAYRQRRAGEPVHLPAKTSSYTMWARRIADHASSPDVARELAWWRATDVAPHDNRTSSAERRHLNTEASVSLVRGALSREETLALLQQVPSAYHTQINDVLLAALARAWQQRTGRTSTVVTLEGHGREPLGADVDVSRTVGWFTSMFPVRLDVPDTGAIWDPENALTSIREHLRQIPRRGIGYGLLRYLTRDLSVANVEPDIVFNYFGQVDDLVAGSTLLRFAPETIGPCHSPKQTRRHALELECLVIDGRLELAWRFSRHLHDAAWMQELAGEFLAALRTLIAHCRSPRTRGRTPSDFPLAALDQTALDRLTTGRDVADIYPLSPLQKLFFAADPSSVRAPFDQWQVTLSGPLDVETFKAAWHETVRRHPVLRSTFHGEDLNEPLQVVHSNVALPWTIEDWTGPSAPTNSAESAWMTLLADDRARPLPIAHAPAMRFTLVRLGGDRWRFLWTTSSLLLDGWSWPVVFHDAAACYDALRAGRSLPSLEGRPYRAYLEWLRREDRTASEQFWRQALAGFREKTPIAGDALDVRHGGERYQEHAIALSADTAAALSRTARLCQVTPSALIQTAWALHLRRQSRQTDVVFGAAVSGRPAEIDGVQEIVGPFVNNVPVRLQIDDRETTERLLKRVHMRAGDLEPVQHLPLVDIQRLSEVPWRDRLFDSLVVYQNYLVGDSDRRFADLGIDELTGPVHSNYPVLLLAEPGRSKLTLVVDGRRIADATARRWANDMATLLQALPGELGNPVADILARLSSPLERLPHKPRVTTAELREVAPPETTTEQIIVNVWQTLLGVDRLSVDANFFELGGQSLAVVRMHESLVSVVGREFPIVAVFEHPTVRALARYLDRPASELKVASGARERARRQKQALAAFRRSSAHHP